jgi:hypothetical protein
MWQLESQAAVRRIRQAKGGTTPSRLPNGARGTRDKCIPFAPTGYNKPPFALTTIRPEGRHSRFGSTLASRCPENSRTPKRMLDTETPGEQKSSSTAADRRDGR